MTLQKHPMDSWRPDNLLEDIMTPEELEKHKKEEQALAARSYRHDIAIRKGKYDKWDRFEAMTQKYDKINFQTLKEFDLKVDDAVSIAYTILGWFVFGGYGEGLIGYLTHEADLDEPLLTSVGKYGKDYYAYLDEVTTIAFTKHRGGKLNRSIKELKRFLQDVSRDEIIDMRNFYATNNGSSKYVKMIHEILCAYKFDNDDNQKLQNPLNFEYTARAKNFDNFYQFFVTAELNISLGGKQELDTLNLFIKRGLYHYSEISLIEAIHLTEYEEAFPPPMLRKR